MVPQEGPWMRMIYGPGQSEWFMDWVNVVHGLGFAGLGPLGFYLVHQGVSRSGSINWLCHGIPSGKSMD